MMRRGPGLVGMAARTAVVAGTATAVSGRVARRQANKYADQDAQYVQQQTAAATQAPTPPPVVEDTSTQIQKLRSSTIGRAQRRGVHGREGEDPGDLRRRHDPWPATRLDHRILPPLAALRNAW
jgi:hypothetical protein